MARKIIEPSEMPLADEGKAAFTEDNKVEVTGKSSSDEDIADIAIQGDIYGLEDHARLLQFMEEPVTIMIHESTDPNAEPMVFCAVNGDGAGEHKIPWLPRGQPVTIKRKFVAQLAKSRPTSIRSQEVVNPIGERSISYLRHSALAYPFSVIQDNNPRGAEWLKAVLAKPV